MALQRWLCLPRFWRDLCLNDSELTYRDLGEDVEGQLPASAERIERVTFRPTYPVLDTLINQTDYPSSVTFQYPWGTRLLSISPP